MSLRGFEFARVFYKKPTKKFYRMAREMNHGEHVKKDVANYRDVFIIE